MEDQICFLLNSDFCILYSMLPLRHQQSRYLFQTFWLLVIVGMALAGASPQLWAVFLLAALFSTLLVKRAACSFACPLFPVGELLWRAGAKLFGRNFVAPFWFDLALRSAKYLVLGWVILALAGKPTGTALISVPMVLFIAGLLVLSLFFQMPWCRYLCPAGALLGLVAMASLLKIRRSPQHCVRCHKCSNRCPANLPVMLRTTLRSPECFACYRCVDGCPAPGALDLATPGKRVVPAWVVGTMVSCLLMLGIIVGTFL